MVEIVWTDPAIQDLDEIADYIALDNVTAAEKLVARVFDRVELLSDSPRSGRRIPEIGKNRYREVIVGPCRVFYRITDSEIVVLHIMRSERKLREYLLEAGVTNDN